MDYRYLDTPVGRLLLAREGRDLRLINFQRNRLPGPDPHWHESPDAFDDVVSQLTEYFAGRRQRFELHLAQKERRFSSGSGVSFRTFPTASRSRTGSSPRGSDDRPPRAPSVSPTEATPWPSLSHVIASLARTARSPATAVGFRSRSDSSRSSAARAGSSNSRLAEQVLDTETSGEACWRAADKRRFFR